MIILRMTMNAIPEKQLELMQTLFSMIEPTEKEAGCVSCSVFCDIEDKTLFSLIGEWENRENLDHHIRSNRFGVLLGTKILLCEPLNIQIFTVVRSEGMEAIVAMRSNEMNSDKHVHKKYRA